MLTAGHDEFASVIIKDDDGNIKYINQQRAGESGVFSIPLPDGISGNIESNISGILVDGNSSIYCSQNGSDSGKGTRTEPFSFERALEMAENGTKVIALDNIVFASDFEWPGIKKAPVITGENSAMIDISNLKNTILDINSDAVFDNITFTAGGEDYIGTIRANGHHLVLKDTVSTDKIFSGIGGASGLNTTVDSVNLEVYGGNFNRIYGGSNSHVLGDCILKIGGNLNSLCNPTDESSGAWHPYIYGGNYNSIIEGDCITTVTADGCAKAYKLYGSSHRGTDVSGPCRILGKTQLNIEGGKFMNVYAAATIDTDEDNPFNGEINMTGGVAEALMGAECQNSITGNIAVNVLGGTVTRRIIGGMYNNWSLSWSSDKCVTGNVTVTIGENFSGMTDKQIGNGIFGGSRRAENADVENGMLIFTGNSYETFKSAIGRYDVCDSHHDYLVIANEGGNVTRAAKNSVNIIPDSGAEYTVNGVKTRENPYVLTAKETNILFSILSGISDVTYTSQDDTSEVSVSYMSPAAGNKVILALYRDNALIYTGITDTISGEETTEFTVPYSLNGEYEIRALLWKADTMLPMCEDFPVSVN